jgi:hypothetical protein
MEAIKKPFTLVMFSNGLQYPVGKKVTTQLKNVLEIGNFLLKFG